MRWLNINTFKKKVNLVLGLLVLLIVLASNIGFVLNLKHNPSINIYAFLAVINTNLFALLLASVIIFRKFIKLYYETKKKTLRTKITTIILLYMFLPISLMMFASSFVIVESVKTFISDKTKLVLRTSIKLSKEIEQSQYEKAILYRNFLSRLILYEDPYSLVNHFDIRAVHEVSDCDNPIVENQESYSICIMKGDKAYVFVVDKDAKLEKSSKALNRFAKEFIVLVKTRDILNGNYVAFIVILALMVVLFTVWFGIFLARHISEPIEELSEAAKTLAKGNLDTKLPTPRTNDELSELIQAFQYMKENLKKLYQNLIKEKDQLNKLLDNIPIGVAYVDKDCNVIRVNKAFLDMFGNTDIKNLDFKDKNIRQDIIELSENEKIFIFEDVSPMVNAQRLSVWKETAQRVAHELKNPLTPIKLNIERLLRISKNHPEKLQDTINAVGDIVLKEIDKILKLLQDFKDFSNIDILDKSKQSIKDAILEAIELYKPYSVDFEIIGDNILEFDKEKIKIVFMNLIQNSIESKSTKIKIEIKPKEIIYQDNGEGIKEISKIFLPYYSSKPTGTGLGLSIVKAIIQKHGWDMKALPSSAGALFVISTL